MNTNPLVVPVFAVEEAIKSLKIVLATAGHPAPTTQAALEVLEQLLKSGPVPMPQAAYDALYDALRAKGIADEAMKKARGKHYQD